MISPDLMKLYVWSFSQRGNVINIGIPACKGADMNKIKLEIKQDSILVSYPDQPPIISGQLFKQIKDHGSKVTDKGLIIALFLESDEKWPSICVAPHPETRIIDPYTAYAIFTVNFNSRDPKLIQSALPFLFSSSDMGYPPALLHYYEMFCKTPGFQEKAKEFFSLCIDKYQFPPAFFRKGADILEQTKNGDEAITYFETAAGLGDIFAKSHIASILSPLSEITYSKKDANQAAKLFESVLSEIEDVNAIVEYSKLLYTGTGVTQDKEKAILLMKKVQEVIPDVTPLSDIDNKQDDKPAKDTPSNEESVIDTSQKSTESSQKSDQPVEQRKKETTKEQTQPKVSMLSKKVDNLTKKVDDLTSTVGNMFEMMKRIESMLQSK